ncbi:MAG: CBS domain-containing protein [Acidimicrobiaceae bacterium]|nr:CBS domain-containing protein [Acidimicrobiaceae bacterium]MYG55626.1 CBS domain-containing protein [Acidimicrobiaceae bacterium]MYJ98694.1 CBS domain-containing protein [Acidimicrobiaceae bacterium]
MKKYLGSVVAGQDVRLLGASVAIGVIVAVVVALFEALTESVLLHWLFDQSLIVLVTAPVVGILAANGVLRWVGRGTSGATSDEYIRTFHERHPRLPIIHLPGKLLAGVATIGMGGAVGMEGPSIYAGSSIGLWVHEKTGSFLRRDKARLLLTAGAAAGIAAVFKAPATGVIFAMEAPYREDVTPQALLPSLLASAASYVTFVSLVGTEPVVPFLAGGGEVLGDSGGSVFGVDLIDLAGALALGIAAGLGGRGFAWLVRRSKAGAKRYSLPKRLLLGGIGLAVLAWVAEVVFESPLTLGPGTEAMAWVVGDRGLGLIALLFGLRMAATITTVFAGGVGGLFIPLAALGVVLGEFVGQAIGKDETTLYPILGLAAFLGAGYRAPIAAVMFVAESTGGVGSFVVPALVAAAVSQVVAGPSSVADYQRSVRLGHLERRFTLPLTSILSTDVMTVPPDATVSEFVYFHVLGRRERVVPVVEGGHFLGLARLDDISELDRGEWEETAIGDQMATDLPVGQPSWTLRDAVAAMEEAQIDILAVTDASGAFIGVVTEDDILKLDEILDETGN